jgi:hypothetical protein
VSQEYFYDHYSIKLVGLYAMVAQDGSKLAVSDPTASAASSSFKLINKFDLMFDLKLLTAATTQLPKVKLVGELPSLRVEMDRNKFAALMDVVNAVTASSKPPQPVIVKKSDVQKALATTQAQVSRDSKRNTKRMTLSGVNKRATRVLSQFIPIDDTQCVFCPSVMSIVSY